jgi:hypothetical protein
MCADGSVDAFANVTAVNDHCASWPRKMIPMHLRSEQNARCSPRINEACTLNAVSKRRVVNILDDDYVPASPAEHAKHILFQRWFPKSTEATPSGKVMKGTPSGNVMKGISCKVCHSPIKPGRRLLAGEGGLARLQCADPTESTVMSGDRWNCSGPDKRFIPPKKPLRRNSGRRLCEQ